MFTRRALALGAVVLGCATLVFVLGGCACLQKEARIDGGTIPQAIDRDLTSGFSLAEDQRLTAHDREIYEAQRHNDVYPEHKGTSGRYVRTPGDEGKLWHWAKD